MVVSSLIKKIEKELNSRHEAYALVEYVTGYDKAYLMLHDFEVDDDTKKKFDELVEKRLNDVPLQYLTNTQYFFGYKFYVDENVLIPRSDTEVLIEKIINDFDKDESLKLLDMCTGSGCIAVTLKNEFANFEVYASDISQNVLNIAEKNARDNGVAINFMLSDLFSNINFNEFDIIVSNPPYIETDVIDSLAKDVKNEPVLALDGGNDGLKFYREISLKALNYLKPNGKLYFEIGYNQANDVVDILTKLNYSNISVFKDYGGNDRVVCAIRCD